MVNMKSFEPTASAEIWEGRGQEDLVAGKYSKGQARKGKSELGFSLGVQELKENFPGIK